MFLLGCHTEDGAFRMHHDGEVDIRLLRKFNHLLHVPYISIKIFKNLALRGQF